MATHQIERQVNSEHAEPAAGISEIVVNEFYYLSLLRAAVKGEWELPYRIFETDPKSKTAIITSRYETVLHIAALNAQEQFVENLVKLFPQSPEALCEIDCDERTALHHAVLSGRIRIVKALVGRSPDLTQIQDNEGRIPFNLSTLEASMHKDIAWFLAQNTSFDGPNHPGSSPNAIQCILGLTYAGHLDIVLYLLEKYPSLILEKGPGETDKSILGVLARMPSHFRSGTRLSVWEILIYKCVSVDVNSWPTDANSRHLQTSTNPGSLCNFLGALQCLTRSLWNVAIIVGSLCNISVALQCLTRLLWNVAMLIVPIKRIHDLKLRHKAAEALVEKICIALSQTNPPRITEYFQHRNLLSQATMNGISELVKLSIQYFPQVIYISPKDSTLRTLAVQNRQERILRLFLKESSANGLSLVPAPAQKESERMMQDAAEHNNDFDYVTNVTGAAFQMQRELQWFKAVESWVPPDVRTARIQGDLTYWQTFVKNHKDLLGNGKQWVKETADKCMLVSTLIATVLFAAAFTVPGSNNDNKGGPLKGSVLVFVIFDVLGLISSVTATLLFLAILTSRNEPLDFLHSLPGKIVLGLSSLFLSLVFMLVAFAAAVIFALDKTLEWVLIPIALLTSIPLTLFAALQLPLLFQMIMLCPLMDIASSIPRAFRRQAWLFPLLFQMIISTYGHSIFYSESI